MMDATLAFLVCVAAIAIVSTGIINVDMLKNMAEMEEKTYTAKAGGGMVEAKVNGKYEVLELTINPDAVDTDDVEMLQDMVVAAVNEAMRAAQNAANASMSKLTGGLNLGF